MRRSNFRFVGPLFPGQLPHVPADLSQSPLHSAVRRNLDPPDTKRAMLLRKRSLFFVPTYPPCTARPFRFSSSPLPRVILTASKHASRPAARRTYATHHASSNNASGQGIPIGKIPLGSGKTGSAKGIAIRDDITKSWKELSFPQKVVRTGAQTTNFAVIIIGVGVLVRLALHHLTDNGIGSRHLLPCCCCVLANFGDFNFQQGFRTSTK
jgi:hypothetical protein